MPDPIPPYPYPIADDKQNSTLSKNDHPDHHNALADGVNSVQEQITQEIVDRSQAIAVLAAELGTAVLRIGGREEDELDMGSVSGTVVVDVSLANSFRLTAAGNLFVSFDNLPDGSGSFDLQVDQDITGSRTAQWAGVEWTTPVLSTTGSDLFRFHVKGARIFGEVLSSQAWTPGQFDDLLAWYRADQIAVADGTLVDVWNDRSPNGNSLTPQSIVTPDRRPTFQTGEINSRPIVRFVTDDSLNSVNFGPHDPPYTVFAVVKPTAIGTLQRFFGGNVLVAFAASGAVRFTCQGSSFVHQSIAANGQVKHITAIGDVSPNASKVRVNGVDNSTPFGSATFTLNQVFLGSNSSLADFFGGDIAEIFVIHHAASAAEYARAEAYMASVWGAPT